MKTIRELINDYQSEVLRGNLLPGRASEILVDLSALIGNILDRITETDMAYNKVLLNHYDSQKTANRAKIMAGTTKEYQEMKDARNAEKVAMELIRSLKYFLKAKEDEYKIGNNF